MGKHTGVIELLETGLKASSLRQTVIANNIANLQTPGYQRAVVRFEQRLAEAMEAGSLADLDGLEPEIIHPPGPGAANGNNVDLDQEIGELVKAGARHKLLLRAMAGFYRKMSQAVGESL